MASNQFLILAIIAILVPTFASATQYIVGDDSGWTINFDYQEWAKDKVFLVGDELVFKYNATLHNVFKVNGTAFDDCTVPPPDQALDTGNDVITLATPGNKWYICGKPSHCSDYFQKLAITVVSFPDIFAPAPAPPSPYAADGMAKKYKFWLP